MTLDNLWNLVLIKKNLKQGVFKTLVILVAGDLGAVDAGDAQVLAVLLQLTHDGAEGSHEQGHGTLGLYCTVYGGGDSVVSGGG